MPDAHRGVFSSCCWDALLGWRGGWDEERGRWGGGASARAPYDEHRHQHQRAPAGDNSGGVGGRGGGGSSGGKQHDEVTVG